MTSYPSRENPGSGLSVLMPSVYQSEPTLYIYPNVESGFDRVPPHLELKAVKTRVRMDQLNSAGPMRKRRWLQYLLLMEFGLKSILPSIRFRPDVLMVGVMNLPVGLLLKRILRARLALTCHNLTEIEFLRANRRARDLARRADLIFVVSDPMRTALEALIPGTAIVVRATGVDLDLFSRSGADRAVQLITVGSFKWKKGYEQLLRAMRVLADRLPDIRLVVVGDGPDREQVERQIADLQLQENIRLTGTVNQAQLAGLLNESAVFVLASLREGLPKALLEALATGTPAVVTTGCNAGEFISEAGIEVPSGDPGAIAEAVLRLLEDRALWLRLSENGPAVAARFSWPAVAGIESRALRGLVGKPAA